MSYRLCKLSLGTSVLTPIFDINTNLIISNICHVDGYGYIFLLRDHHCLGHADYKGKITIPWMGYINEEGDREGSLPLFKYPSSICYYPDLKSCFLFSQGGTKLNAIEIASKYCSNISLSSSFLNYFSKLPLLNKIDTSCDVDKYGNLYWVVKDLHRCFKKKREDNEVVSYIGSGRSGFSISNNLNACLLSNPYGIRCRDSIIYISDGGNHCVRNISGDIVGVTYGNPLNNKILNFPSQIRFINSIMYVIDCNEIKYFSLNDKNNGIIYTSPNIVGIENNKKELLVLERNEKENRSN